jgi:hypothetical protein
MRPSLRPPCRGGLRASVFRLVRADRPRAPRLGIARPFRGAGFCFPRIPHAGALGECRPACRGAPRRPARGERAGSPGLEIALAGSDGDDPRSQASESPRVRSSADQSPTRLAPGRVDRFRCRARRTHPSRANRSHSNAPGRCLHLASTSVTAANHAGVPPRTVGLRLGLGPTRAQCALEATSELAADRTPASLRAHSSPHCFAPTPGVASSASGSTMCGERLRCGGATRSGLL